MYIPLKKISQTFREPSVLYTRETKYEIKSPSDKSTQEFRIRSKSRKKFDDSLSPIESLNNLIKKIESELGNTNKNKNVPVYTGYNDQNYNYGYNYQQQSLNNYYQPNLNYGYGYPYNYNQYQTNNNYNHQQQQYYSPQQSFRSSNLDVSEESRQYRSRKQSKSRERSKRTKSMPKINKYAHQTSSPRTISPTKKSPTPLLKLNLNPQCEYKSKIEESIRNSTAPIPSNEVNIIEINGIRGIWLNKEEVENWKGEIPLSEYDINTDPEPQVVKLKHAKCLDQIKKVSIKYLKPPKLEEPGPIIIKQEPNYIPEQAPPIIIRQIPDQPIQAEPLVIREKPPSPPEPIQAKTIVIPGKRLPPPPRRVIIEKIAQKAPELPSITVERWLPYEKQERKVILEKRPPDMCYEQPKNLVIEWEPQCVNNRTVVTDLGVEDSDPFYYSVMHKDNLKSTAELPKFALEAKKIEETIPRVDLVGDIEALKLIDLEREGLVEYKRYIK